MKFLSILLLCLFSTSIKAQTYCKSGNTSYFFNSNKIAANFQTNGLKFQWNEDYPTFQVPYPHEVNSIKASSPWIAGFVNGELRMAAQAYRSGNGNDFYPGPLNTNGAIYPELCSQFDRPWRVYREDIIKHIFDFLPDGKIDHPVASVLGWPAQGNPNFKDYNGFDLPENHHGEWADFADLDNNNIYEPLKGEYPVVRVKNKEYVPDQILWMAFNDIGPHNITNSTPLGVEIQLTVYGFNCTDNPMLNNALFNNYKIINQSANIIDSSYFGMFNAYELGCYEETFMGSDTLRNTEFVYISEEDLNCSPGFDLYPPVLSMTYLTQAMNSFIKFQRNAQSSIQYYRLLTGKWRDNTPITSFGTGYNPGSMDGITKFLFYGDPRDSNQWNHQQDPSDPFKGATTISSVSLNQLNPGEIANVETVYQFHQDSLLDNLEQIGFMHYNVDLLKNSLDNLDGLCLPPLPCLNDDCVWPGDFNRDGIADHFDLLHWGLMKDHSGSARNGLVSWRGHYSEQWENSTLEGVNYKHGDANGDGSIEFDDLERNTDHFLLTNHLYEPDHQYPEGPEILLTADPVSMTGNITRFNISTAVDLNNVFGIAYELEYDTLFFEIHPMNLSWPGDPNSVIYSENANMYVNTNLLVEPQQKFAAVNTNHTGSFIPKNSPLQKSIVTHGFSLKPGVSVYDLFPTTTIRLRNLIAIDSDGNNLNIGANQLTLTTPVMTAVPNFNEIKLRVFPNPAEDFLSFDSSEDLDAELVNIHGQVMTKFLLTSSKPLDVRPYPKGVYYIRIPSANLVSKVVIQ